MGGVGFVGEEVVVLKFVGYVCEASHPDTPVDGPPDLKAAEVEGEQAKKRRGRKKSKLEDMFPVYLQVRASGLIRPCSLIIERCHESEPF